MTVSKKSTKSYNDLSLELEAILVDLQRDEVDIDEALKGYERGLAIIKELEKYLQTAENRVTELRATFSNDS